jgi:hypothetical protein
MRDIPGLITKLEEQCEELGLDQFVPVIARLRINEFDLVTEYADQAALYAFVATEAELAHARRKAVEGRVNGEIRKDYGKKKPPEAALSAEVQEDDDVIEAREKESFLVALAEAFKQRMQMLISIGADMREERRGTDLPMPRARRDGRTDGMEKEAASKTTTPDSRKKGKKRK